MALFGDKDDAVYIIPVEAKKKITEGDAAQLAQYMTTLENGPYIQGNVTLGLLINETLVQFGFLILHADNASATPLSLIFISPPVPWRKGVLLSREICIGMCLIHNLQLTRLCACGNWETCLGKETWKTIQEVGSQVEHVKVPLPKLHASLPCDSLQNVGTLQHSMDTAAACTGVGNQCG